MILSFLRDEDNERMNRCQGKKQKERGDIRIVKGRGVCYERISGMIAMDKKERESLGAYLRREREAREIKLTAVSKATKISMPLLVALEADDHDAFPNKKAIPDCLKSYCRYLLIDEQEALRCFELHPARHSPETIEMFLPEIEEISLPEAIVNSLPPHMPADLSELPPTVIPTGGKAGFFRRRRLVFLSIALFVFFFVLLAGIIFYFHPLWESTDKKDVIKVEVPPVPAQSKAPAVNKEKVVGNRGNKQHILPGETKLQRVADKVGIVIGKDREIRKGELKTPDGSGKEGAIKNITYEKGADAQDKIMVALDRVIMPKTSNLGEGRPRIVMDFLHAQYGKGLPLHIDTKGLYVQRIRVGRYLAPTIKTRIVLDLVPGQKYSTDQVFDDKKKVYSVTVKSLSPAAVPTPSVGKKKVIGNRDSKRYHLPGMKYYHQVEEYHRVEFDSEAAAIQAGFHKAPR